MKKETLDEKYARLWHATNSWEIPDGFKPSGKIRDNAEKEMFVSGMFQVLNELFEDGLISEATLRRQHDQMEGMQPGQSKISRTRE